jgi:exo-beta-1,3-glucanase (GH17 family)
MAVPRFLLAACLPLAIAACGGGNAPPPATASSQAQSQSQSAEAEATIGAATMHVSAVQTSQLPEPVARQYGIERSPRRILLLVNLREVGAGSAPSVTATVTDLQQHTTPVALRVVAPTDASTLDYIGTIDATLPDTLRFQVLARHGAAMASVQLSRDFYPQ